MSGLIRNRPIIKRTDPLTFFSIFTDGGSWFDRFTVPGLRMDHLLSCGLGRTFGELPEGRSDRPQAGLLIASHPTTPGLARQVHFMHLAVPLNVNETHFSIKTMSTGPVSEGHCTTLSGRLRRLTSFLLIGRFRRVRKPHFVALI